MEEELLLRLLIVGAWAIFGAIRIRYRLPASRRAAGDKYELNRIVMGILSFGIVAYIVTLILYAVYIPLILWFSFSLPSVIRWLGVVAALLCAPFLYWIHSTLDKQYSADLSIKDGHNLIEIGPYRKVRHPMYTVFIVFTISIAIITANVLCIIFSLLISCSFPSIAKSEELMLIDAFGDEYNSYMGRTGRFFPPLRLNS